MSPSPGTKVKKILVIDDEPHVVTYLETLLQDNGYETASAANGREAMEKVKTEKPDAITLDITMPEQSGIRFYRDLKENPEFADIPVLVVTAVTGYGGDPDTFENFLKSRRQIPPPEGFFSKPIDRDEFLQAVEELVRETSRA
jgi:CheY-like chemotaxis protein